MPTKTLEDQIADIELQITTVADVQVIDRLEVTAQDTANAHGGVIVNAPSTDVLDGAAGYRQQDITRVTDTITVALSWHLKPNGQKTSRDEAIGKARQIRKALTTLTWNRRTRFIGEERAVSKGWYLITQTYEFDRTAVLGG